jgi:hypothetical protein
VSASPTRRFCRVALRAIPTDDRLRLAQQDDQETTGMKKPASKIREEITRLQDQLKQAETREAERIGRLALKAGLGEVEVEDIELVAALEEVAVRFRRGSGRPGRQAGASVPSGASQGSNGEA